LRDEVVAMESAEKRTGYLNRRGHRFAAAISLVGLALVSGCSSISTKTTPSGAPVPRSSWVARELPVHTRLSATRDSIVYGGVERGNLVVVALDPETGSERWRRSSDVSGRIPGVEQSILTDGDTAYFLEKSSGASPALVAVISASGEERWRRVLETRIVDPDIWSCGDAICLIAITTRQEVWRIAKIDGHGLSKNPIPEVGSGFDAMLTEHSESADAPILLASHPGLPPADVVYIRLFWDLGATKAWSKPASELFGATRVSPDGGWNGVRVDSGWITWLGPELDVRDKHKPGDVVPPGAVAGFDDQGHSRWIAPGLHICWVFRSSTPVFCDGATHVTATAPWELRPQVVEGRDEVSGEVRWKLELGGEIDEFHLADRVRRIDDDRYLVDLASGRILLDVRRGPEPAPPDLMAAWCDREPKGDSIGGRLYLRARHAVPCRTRGDPAGPSDPALPIPQFAGVNVAGWGAWVEDGAVHARRD
jgi:hypothetical protein